MRNDRHVEIQVTYNRDLVSDTTDAAIQRILRKAAREIHAKAALLSNPDLVEVSSKEFIAGKYVDLNLDEPDDADR